MGKAEVSERTLARIWENGLPDAASLFTESGEPVRVVYRGRRNTDSGPDFVVVL